MTAAAWHANAIGLPLNRYITINWSTAGVVDPRHATAAFLKLAGDWISSRGYERAYIWVRENDGGDHVHILIHVPRAYAREFTARQRGWLKVVGASTAKGAVQTRPVARDYAAAWTSPSYYKANLDNVVRYLLKGACETAAMFADHRRRPTGIVRGMRAGTSYELGTRAREAFALGQVAASLRYAGYN